MNLPWCSTYGGMNVFRPLIKVVFLARAAFEIGRERAEDALDSLTARAGEYKSKETDRLDDVKDRVKSVVGEVSQHIWQRSEIIENQMRERIRRQVADFSLGALGDTTEINELRAEIATLRAEIADLKSSKSLV
jgi:polyhydroxyalkanoate synthesis regulator phasin